MKNNILIYLRTLKSNLELISSMTRQHLFLIKIAEEYGYPLTEDRIREFKDLNKRVQNFLDGNDFWTIKTD